MRFGWWSRGTPSLRTRLLVGVMVPSTLVLGAGAVVGVDQITNAVDQERSAVASTQAAIQGADFFPSLIAERGASMLYLAAPTPENRGDLDEARSGVDNNFQRLREAAAEIARLLPPELRSPSTLASMVDRLPALRAQVDARTIARVEVYQTFNQMTDVLTVGNNIQGSTARTSASADAINRSGELNRVADLIDRANSVLVAGSVAGDLSRVDFDEFLTSTGAYRGMLTVLVPQLEQAEQQRVAGLQASPEWQRVAEVADAVIARGFPAEAEEAAPLPDPVDAGAAARSLATQFMRMSFERTAANAGVDAAAAQNVVRTTALIAGLVLLALIGAFLIALVVTTRLVRRLAALRRETLELARNSLPDTVDRLRRGDRLDLDRELPRLDHGRDELGEVAAAFNKAQRTAVEAAVEEAHTREGFNTAFLNIARRSQAILHQQMQVLDRIERAVTDPDQLELLFALDHLATRERRNAENLIILGGEQPRRQWRNPVALGDLVRAAVGESEHYQRVSVAGLPQVMVAGSAVGDLVHLMAELVDNATAFSPPGAPIEVHGTVVGRGVVVEVEDQGLGIEDDQLAELNEMLRNPPDFGLFTLSRDSRIGLFVVARLARRHNVTVSLRSSAFGGIRAGVLVPTTVLADQATPAGAPGRARPVPVGVGIGATTGPIRTAASRPAATVREVSEQPAPAPRQDPEPDYFGGDDDGDRPRLPRRTRQAHMDARLLSRLAPSEPVRQPPDPDTDLFSPPEYSPEVARSRMSALRRGTVQARSQDVGEWADEWTEGDHE